MCEFTVKVVTIESSINSKCSGCVNSENRHSNMVLVDRSWLKRKASIAMLKICNGDFIVFRVNLF